MTKREIVVNALHHRSGPVVPYHCDLTEDLRKKVEDELGPEWFAFERGLYIARKTEGHLDSVGPNLRRDRFGVTWRMDQRGDFGVVDEITLKEPTLRGYIFPEPDEAAIRRDCEHLVQQGKETGVFTMYGVGFSLFERAWSLRGMENLLMDFLLEPDFADELLDRICAYDLAVMQIALEYPVDCVYYGDDWGQQRGMIMGPAHWRRFLKPRLAKMYGIAKQSGRYTCQHSCGDIHEVFADLIEIGLDIYDTFQPEIYDPETFKREYGDRLSILGGVSAQQTLPHGTPDQVRAETRRMMEVMGKDGGYICAPTHAVTDDVPLENLMAFLETVQNQ